MVNKFYVYCVNKTRQLGDQQQHGIAAEMVTLFQQVCSGSQEWPQANVTWFTDARPLPEELVVYFVPDQNFSVLRRVAAQERMQYQPPPGTHAGQTGWVPARGMISEVWLDRAGPTLSLIARCAFHELMHNKLDQHPQLRQITDLHSDGGLGLAMSSIQWNTPLTPRNVTLMQQALRLQIPQLWEP